MLQFAARSEDSSNVPSGHQRTWRRGAPLTFAIATALAPVKRRGNRRNQK